MKRTSRSIQRKTVRYRAITTHILPYENGLARETHDFVGELNVEAARLRTGVRYIATANRIEARGDIDRAARFTSTLGSWFLQRSIAAGYVEGEAAVLQRGNSYWRAKLRKRAKTKGARIKEKQIQKLLDDRLRLRHKIEDSDALLGSLAIVPAHWPKKWRHGLPMPLREPHNKAKRLPAAE